MEREQEEQVQPASTYASDWAGTVDQGAGEVGSSAVNREFKIRRLRATNYGWTSVVLCS